MNYTRTLAEYAVKLRYEDLPAEVIEQAKLLTLHVLGVALAACVTRQGKDATSLAKAMGGKKIESTIIGDGSKVSCVQAAFVNGTLADVLDWEDCSPTGHPSAGAIPSALAVGEKIDASGRDYITSVVAGYEVYQRIAMAIQPSFEFWKKTGWGLTSWQIFASAVPAARLLQLDEDKMAQTIGIAAALTPVVSRKINPDSRSYFYHYQHGFTSRDGVVAALTAQSGIDSMCDVLDGETGYWVSVSDKCDWDWMTKGLGKDYLIMQTYFKHWPANMWIQQYLDIVDAIIKEDSLKADEVSEIIVSPSMQQKSSRMIHRPEGYLGIMDAEFSIPYCLAVLLHDPQPGPNWFTDDKLKDPEILKLAGKVRATDPEVNPYENFEIFQKGGYPEARVEIITCDGRRLSKSLRYPKGHPKNRLTRDEYKERFRRTASFVLKPDKVEAAIEKIFRLEEMDTVSEVMDLVHTKVTR
ncbi:MmgE/PrpD family protein [Chloroflexota bacterium]